MAKKNSTTNSRHVQSNQTDVHEDLEKIVRKHMSEAYEKPIAMHTLLAFDEIAENLERLGVASVILDSGCGAGDSSIYLAEKFPHSIIIGIDKSFVRLQKSKHKDVPDNVLFARADQFDFWRLVANLKWQVEKHFIFYPNPWPKKAHVKRRIHGHPSFIDLIKITKNIELRSNWAIYVEEFNQAWQLVTGDKCTRRELDVTEPVSLFEKKFNESGHTLYRLTTIED
jgi:tRNA G46 methylase TrmB